MTDNHPITVPTGSIACWRTLYRETYQGDLSETEYIANEAAQWGADQELEACCEWLIAHRWKADAGQLRAARRPKPPSLKEQALDELYLSYEKGYLKEGAADTIRRALELLPDTL
jgi:hypothetical protein